MKVMLGLLGVLLVASVASSTKRPNDRVLPVVKMNPVEVVALGPNVIIRGYWKATGNPGNIITQLVTGGTTRQHDLPGSATSDTFQIARPAAGTTITGNFCVQSRRVGWTSSTNVCSPWSYAEVGTLPPPVIDSVRADTLVVSLSLFPDTSRVLVGASIEFCPVWGFGDGAVALRAVDQTPGCLTYIAGKPQASALQQAMINGRCLSWKVTSGTFDPRHPCDQVVVGA